jgi:hypothetical protein
MSEAWNVVATLSAAFSIQNGLQQEDALPPSSEYIIRKAHGIWRMHQLFFYVNDVNLLHENINNIQN